MTDVNKNKSTLVTSPNDVMSFYTPPPAPYAGRIGAEIEMPVVKPAPGVPKVPTPDEMKKIQDILKNRGFNAQLEPAGVIEYATESFKINDVNSLAWSIKSGVENFNQAIAEQGMVRSPFSIVPTTTEQAALNNIVSRERLQVSIQAMKEIFPPNTLRLPLLTSSVQTSFSPEDPETMFRMMYRAYALTPLLMAACNTLSGFVVNEDKKIDYLPRAKYYLGYGRAGGISEAFLKAANGKELINNHIQAVFDAPMHFYYDLQGNIFPASTENPVTFRDLIKTGLNTLSNYEAAESFLYNDVKICNLRDDDGNVIGKRLEVRGADSGIDTPVMAVLMTAAIVPDGSGADAFMALLKEYGFTGTPAQDAALLQSARTAVVDHNGKFMDVGFGKDPQTGKSRRLRDFAADVAGLLETVYCTKNGMPPDEIAPDLEKLMTVLLTGNCAAKTYAETFSCIGDAAACLQPTPKQNGPQKDPGYHFG